MDLPSRATPTLARAATIAGVLVLVLVLAGCGSSAGATNPAGATSPAAAASPAGGTPAPVATAAGGPSSQGPATGTKAGAACDLLTDAAIKDATGFGVLSKIAVPTYGSDDTGCRWKLDNPGFAPNEVLLSVYSPAGRQYYDTFIGPYGDAPVAGLGDGAVRYVANTVNAVQGDVMVTAQYISFPDVEDVPVELIRAVFDELRS